MINLIREELDKENPDWLSISNMAQKLFIEANKPNILGIRDNIINVVKVADHNVSDVIEILEPVFTNAKVIGVGGYKSLTVPAGVKEIKKYPDETIIVVTDRDALLKHLGNYQYFRCSISNRYSKERSVVKWTNVDTGELTNFFPDELKMLIREHKLNEILNE